MLVNIMKLNELPSLRGKRALFYDTETTGFPRDGYPLESQPRVVQLAWQLVVLPDDDHVARLIAESQCVLNLDGDRSVPKGAADIHGITTAKVHAWGLEPEAALDMFHAGVDRADVVVAHNEQFDRKLMSIMFRIWGERLRWSSDVFDCKRALCTMELSRDIVKLPPTPRMIRSGRTGHKSPKLSEAFEHFTGDELVGAHDAMVDVRATVTVFEALMAAADVEARNEG